MFASIDHNLGHICLVPVKEEMKMARYKVWCPMLGQSVEDAKLVTSSDPQGAAEEWAQWSDYSSAEYSIVRGEHVTVVVLDLDINKSASWIVTGESVPHYSARLIVTPQDDEYLSPDMRKRGYR